MKELKVIIANNIIELRQKSNMTQSDLAMKLNYTDKAVSKWERGESMPDITVLANIAEIFGVTLDWLVSPTHDDNQVETDDKTTLTSPISAYKKMKSKMTNKIIVTCISILLVWFVATLIFVIIDIITKGAVMHYIAFAYAVPASAVVWLVFNSIWFNSKWNYYIVSLLMWSLLLSIYITLFMAGLNMWQLFLLGIPGQTIIILWSLLSFKAQKKIISEDL